MATLMIGYDLNSAGQNYDDLIASIKKLGNWCHFLDSTWFIKAAITPVQARDVLSPHLDSNDELLVINVSGDVAAWVGLSAEANQWLRDNI